jgi:ribosomal protein S18 acetylase RimI-like enzyme
MSITINRESPDTSDASALIGELDALLAPLYPVQSRHGYSIEKLLREGTAFFVARAEGEPAGCGGLQLVGWEYGEIKRMYVRPQFRRRGLGRQMLDHLTEYARVRKVGLLRLETGIHQVEAIELYERLGSRRIPPFGAYRIDRLSLCYEKEIS